MTEKPYSLPRIIICLTSFNILLMALILRLDLIALISSFEDDFFYYLVIARNVVNHGSLSFDGTSLTNGFHPLWLLVISALTAILKNPDHAVYAIKILCVILPAFGMLNTINYLQLKFSSPHVTVRILLISLIYYCLSLSISMTGMEISLTLMLFPLFLTMIEKGIATIGTLFKFTILCCLIVLSRLDIAICVIPIWLIIFFQHIIHLKQEGMLSAASLLKVCIASLSGWVMLFVYAFCNIYFFGYLLPHSAIAKALALYPGPYKGALNILDWPIFKITASLWLLSLLGFFSAARQLKHLCATDFIVMAFPVIFLTALVFRSPWPLWVWYLYPLPIAITVGFACFFSAPHKKPFNYALTAVAILLTLAVPVFFTLFLTFGKLNSTIVSAAVRLKDFEEKHPGVYAMGDRAGTVGYLLTSPVIQLEGLVSGKSVLEAINQQNDLLDFLVVNNVDYYISTSPKELGNNCFHAKEPPTHPQELKRMQTLFCAKPLMHFTLANETFVAKTYVFAVKDMKSWHLQSSD